MSLRLCVFAGNYLYAETQSRKFLKLLNKLNILLQAINFLIQKIPTNKGITIF